jgi:predicted dehydrogenase
VNQFQWNNDALVEVVGEKGTLRFQAAEQRLSVYKNEKWHASEYHCERDDYFVSQAHNFLDAVEGKATVRCTVSEAAETVRTVAAAMQSWRERREVRVR